MPRPDDDMRRTPAEEREEIRAAKQGRKPRGISRGGITVVGRGGQRGTQGAGRAKGSGRKSSTLAGRGRSRKIGRNTGKARRQPGRGSHRG